MCTPPSTVPVITHHSGVCVRACVRAVQDDWRRGADSAAGGRGGWHSGYHQAPFGSESGRRGVAATGTGAAADAAPGPGEADDQQPDALPAVGSLLLFLLVCIPGWLLR